MSDELYCLLDILYSIYNRPATLDEVRDKYLSYFFVKEYRKSLDTLISEGYVVKEHVNSKEYIKSTGKADIEYHNEKDLGNHPLLKNRSRNIAELNKAANEILHIMLSRPDKKTQVRTDDYEITSDQTLRENAISIFRFMEDKPSKFLDIFQHSTNSPMLPAPLGATIKQAWLQRMEEFSRAGGFDLFNDYEDFRKKELEKKYNSNPTIDNSLHFHAPVTNSNIAHTRSFENINDLSNNKGTIASIIGSQNAHLEVHADLVNNTANTIPTLQETTKPPTDKPIGAYQKFSNFCQKHIIAIIIGIIGSLLASWIVYRFHLFSPPTTIPTKP